MDRLKLRNFAVESEKFVGLATTAFFLAEFSLECVRPDPKHTKHLPQLQSPKRLKNFEFFLE